MRSVLIRIVTASARPEVASVQQVDRAVASRHAESRSRALPVFSKCTGQKKALCIGINYTGQRNELHGCVNDAKNVRKFLMKQWNFKPDHIFLLTDDAAHGHQQPTRANILEAMRWLVRDACPHDSLVFHYSGHGGQTRDLDGDEVDGLDEVIFPVDYKHAGFIVDDEMHRIMVKNLPNGCRLTAIFDSCHSGSALDLPYLYHSDGRVKGLSEVTPSHLREKTTKADVISWSGCADSQTSADTFEGGAAVGAMSYVRAVLWVGIRRADHKDQTYQQLLQHLRQILHKNYSQKPQLSSSHRIVRVHEPHVRSHAC
ncbi:peptidase C14, caspase domain-containing protein [Fomitopsis serialis]|uniref:peptidase C14, caspase domain-containing protein n=1 Tax=Fomitopsis serialis TaxID=139415 RepID=UPI002008E0C5|nr:peptidase C14, caspase domain-containing protein [Neoantrodia serialis]KAH9923816.1 peptidase C14, caspase domain-containing protein [Neoantrodia serialis]